ncbi:MAG: hypothetical protein EA417_08540 [Gammaproteobacteria bacterium]|nr:MAG: hypothetical protein EA417_08540 [Gammaproteobacteria bacterium]
MVVGGLKPRPPRACPIQFCHAETGHDAIRLIHADGIRQRLDVIVAEDGLFDMPGLNILRRLAGEAPRAARVLLLDEGYLTYLPEELAELGIDDSWIMPQDGRALVKRVLARRRSLARTHAVHQRLEALTRDLEDLEKRHFHVRMARDRLARNVETALLVDEFQRDRMLRWWQAYRAMVQFRIGLCPIRPTRMRIVEFLAPILAREELERWPFPGRLPDREHVWLDPVLVGQMGRCLFRGLLEAGEPFATVRWGRMHASPETTTIELKVEPIRECIEDVYELLEDPFARLPDGPLRDLSIDLPFANEMLQAQGGTLKGILIEPQLVVEWHMPRRRPELPHPLAHPPRPLGNP